MLPQELSDHVLHPLFLPVDLEVQAAHGGVVENAGERVDRSAALRIEVVSIDDCGVVRGEVMAIVIEDRQA